MIGKILLGIWVISELIIIYRMKQKGIITWRKKPCGVIEKLIGLGVEGVVWFTIFIWW